MARARAAGILVVDDDRLTRHLTRSVLTKAGYRVRTANNGLEALRALKSARFDLILLDVWMPRMDGLAVLDRVKRDKQAPKVIVLTSDDAPDTVLKAMRRRAHQFAHKPLEPAALLTLVRPADVRESVGYAFRELLLNAIEWGGKLDPRRRVRISYVRAKRMLLYRIADPGPGFSMEGLTHAAISHPHTPMGHDVIREQKRIRPGGFGILMVLAKMDELIYNEAQNDVMFVKYLD